MLLLPIASIFSHVLLHPNTIATKLCRHVETQQIVLVNVVLGPSHGIAATVWITRHGKPHPITGHQHGQLVLAVQGIQPITKHIRYFRGVAHRDTVFAVAGQGHIRLRGEQRDTRRRRLAVGVSLGVSCTEDIARLRNRVQSVCCLILPIKT